MSQNFPPGFPAGFPFPGTTPPAPSTAPAPGPFPGAYGAPPGMPAAPAPGPFPGAYGAPPPQVDTSFADRLNSAPLGPERLPRIEAGAVADCIVERVHLVPSRDRKTFIEIVLRVEQSNHAAMPAGHRWSVFQDTAYDGAPTMIRAWILAILGHKPDAQIDANAAVKAAIGPENPLAGSRVRARGAVRSPSKGRHVGKSFVDPVLEPASATPLPPVDQRAAAKVAAPAPAAPASVNVWTDPATGIRWDCSTNPPRQIP